MKKIRNKIIKSFFDGVCIDCLMIVFGMDRKTIESMIRNEIKNLYNPEK